MTRARKGIAAPPPSPVLNADAEPGEDENLVKARTMLRPSVQAAMTLRSINQGAISDDLSLQGLVDELTNQVLHIRDSGELTRPEAMLVTQAHTLDALFNRLTRQAIPNIGHYPDAVALYLKLALRAQSQARATIETLNEMKNPRQLAFVAQAHVGHNVQVNHRDVERPARSEARTHGETVNEQTGLLETSDGERLDARTAISAREIDTALAALDPIHRPPNR